MWKTVCRDCGWTTTQHEIDSAFGSAQAHAQERPGHSIVIDPVDTVPLPDSIFPREQSLAPPTRLI